MWTHTLVTKLSVDFEWAGLVCGDGFGGDLVGGSVGSLDKVGPLLKRSAPGHVVFFV